MRPRLPLDVPTGGLAVTAAPFPRTPRRPALDDLQLLQGRWEIIRHTSGDGGNFNERGFTLTVEKSRWTFAANGQERSRWDVKLNPAASPREADLARVGGGS